MSLESAIEIYSSGASSSYEEVTVSNITSSIDSSVTNLSYRRCHNLGHVGTAKLIPTMLFAGFGSSGIAEFPDSMVERMSRYKDPTSGRAPLLLKLNLRTNRDYCRDTQDAADLLDHAITSVGSSVYGTSAICIGYSTGALDALLFAARYPDRCLGVVLYYPNYDIGLDPKDSYYVMQSDSNRAIISGRVQPSGDIRLSSVDSSLDEYITRNAIDSLPQIMGLEGGPHVWILSDVDDTEVLPSVSRLVSTLGSTRESSIKVHSYSSQSGDSLRILHSLGDNSDGAIYAERYYFPYLLKNAVEWSMPDRVDKNKLRVLGWIKTRLFELWLGETTTPKSDATGGLNMSADLAYSDSTRQYSISPVTTPTGYCQIIRDRDNRDTAISSVNYSTNINLNRIRDISTVQSIGVTHSFRADAGVTDSSGVTNWTDQIGGLSFTASTNKPSYTVDSNGKNIIRFSGASSQKLLLNSLLVTPTQDFTLFIVASKTNSTYGSLFELSHHGTYSRVGLAYNSGTDSGYAFDNSNNWAISNTNGIGSHIFSQNTPHVFALMRYSDRLYLSMDGSNWSYSGYINLTFTTTGTNTTSIGCGWADGGGAYHQFFTGDVYELDSKPAATSECDVFSYKNLMQSRWSF